MFNIFVEAPSGARSRGYDREKEDDAERIFNRVKEQLTEMKFGGTVVLSESGKEIKRETVIAS